MSEVLVNPVPTAEAGQAVAGKRTRRSKEQMIADLLSKVEALKSGEPLRRSGGGGRTANAIVVAYKDATTALNRNISIVSANPADYPDDAAIGAFLNAQISAFGTAAFNLIKHRHAVPNRLNQKNAGKKVTL